MQDATMNKLMNYQFTGCPLRVRSVAAPGTTLFYRSIPVLKPCKLESQFSSVWRWIAPELKAKVARSSTTIVE